MKKRAIYTSITSNYLPKALALYESVARHEDVDFYCVVNEYRHAWMTEMPKGFNVLFLEDLFEEKWRPWILMHDIVELCTATKPFALGNLLNRDYEAVMYIDPDIYVFNPLEDLFAKAQSNHLVLCPHVMYPPTRYNDILNNEISALKHGVFNLGFICVKNSPEGRSVFDFWSSRCLYFCEADLSRGVFTDQKFFDLAPIYFPYMHICRNPGADVASWNVHERNLHCESDGAILVNGFSLLFYHFTSYDSGTGLRMSRIYGKDSPILFELWTFYEGRLKEINASLGKEDVENKLPRFLDGSEVRLEDRKLLRSIFRVSRTLDYKYASTPTVLVE